MKIHILVCRDEDRSIVSIQPFKTHELAFASMKEQREAKREAFKEEHALEDDHDFIEDGYAATGNDRYHYTWEIFEREL